MFAYRHDRGGPRVTAVRGHGLDAWARRPGV